MDVKQVLYIESVDPDDPYEVVFRGAELLREPLIQAQKRGAETNSPDQPLDQPEQGMIVFDFGDDHYAFIRPEEIGWERDQVRAVLLGELPVGILS